MKKREKPKSEHGNPKQLPKGTTSYQRLGLVAVSITSLRGHELTSDVWREVLGRSSPRTIVERLAVQVRELGIKQFIDELAYIETRMKSQNYSYTGRDDPVRFAIESLDRAMMIASTDQFYETLVKYNVNAKSRAEALKRNRAAASRFPPGSREERALVASFRPLVESGKHIRNIPSMLHADYKKKSDDAPSLMSIRRTLQRLELLPAPKPRKSK